MDHDTRMATARMLREAAALVESGRMTGIVWVDLAKVTHVNGAHGKQGSLGAHWRFEGVVDCGAPTGGEG